MFVTMHGFVYIDIDGDLRSNLVITVINPLPTTLPRERERDPFTLCIDKCCV